MWSKFGVSSRGGTHISRDLPCQDASACREGAGYWIAAAADGHGSRKHFRSQTGSELACVAACDCLERFAQGVATGNLPTETEVQLLKQNILLQWRQAVEADAANRAWTSEELLEQKALLDEAEYAALTDDRGQWIPYGTTLAALLVTQEFYLAVQIGDGEVLTISRAGEFAWPMPESKVNQGRFTASMCMAEPMPEFRHCMSRELPAALLAYTDGVEKAFPSRSKALVEFLYAVYGVACCGDEDEVRSALNVVAQLGPAKDDATLAGLIDTSVNAPAPQVDEMQRTEELNRVRARMNDCSSALAYNRACLQRMSILTPEDALAAEQMEQIVQRCSQQLEALRAEEQRLMGVEVQLSDAIFDEEGPDITWAAPPVEADGETNDTDDI